MPITRNAARAAFPTERAMALWSETHAALLLTRPRAELHAAWDAACLGMKSEGNRLSKSWLAGDLARHDARSLGQSWPDDPTFNDDLDACEARVRAIGTPTPWASTS